MEDELFNAALQSATAPDDTPPTNGAQQTPMFNDTGDGSSQKRDADKVFAATVDPTSAKQQQLYAFGNQARDKFNKAAYNEARQDGFERNFQEGKNIPIESKFANYNNMSWEDTQRLSRLADAYNNGYRWTPGKVGIDAAGTSVPQFVKREPIETEEMRRMNMTRQGLQQQQAYALGRANDILAYPQKLTEAFDKLGMDADAAAMEIQRNFADYAQRAQYDEQYRAEYEQALQKGLLYWSEEMAQYQKSKVAAVLYNEMANNPTYAQWVAANLVNAPMPSQQQYLASMITAQIQRSGIMADKRPEEIMSEVEAVLGKLTGYEAYQSQLMAGYAAGQAGYGSVAGGRAGVTGKLRY